LPPFGCDFPYPVRNHSTELLDPKAWIRLSVGQVAGECFSLEVCGL
jgi:hypothetical protein